MKIDIKGVIINSDDQWIYDWFGIEATSPKKVSDLLKQAVNGEELEVEINSGGGSVFAGSEIYTTLKDYKGNVTVKIVGVAASAASVIAMCGDEILISPTGQIMIHNASCKVIGDHRDMQHGADFLKGINETISNAYALKTGLSNEELLELMDKETWLTPQQSLEKGFVDKIMFTENIRVTNSIGNLLLPEEVINKMRSEIMNKKNTGNDNKKSLENKEKEIEIALSLI